MHTFARILLNCLIFISMFVLVLRMHFSVAELKREWSTEKLPHAISARSNDKKEETRITQDE